MNDASISGYNSKACAGTIILRYIEKIRSDALLKKLSSSGALKFLILAY